MQGDILSIIENKPQNYLMNGDFAISQRFGANNITPAAKYGVDRWFFANGADCERVAETGQPFAYSLRTTATASGNTHLQRIESKFIRHLKNKTVTFSIKLRLESGSLGDVPMLRIGYANAVDNFSATTLVSDNTLESDAPIDGTFRTFKKSFVVTEQMAENGFYVQVGDFSSGTNVIRYAHAMLNEGSYAANFQLAGKHFLKELELCQRYFDKSYNVETSLGTITDNGAIHDNTYNNTSVGLYVQFYFKKRMRTNPIITPYSPVSGNVNVIFKAGTGDIAPATYPIGETSARISVNNTGNKGVRAHWAADAEL